MSDQASSEFNRAFCAQVKALRERKGWTQRQMSTALGLSLANYQKYESRTPLPHRYVPSFCLIVGTTESELYAAVTRARESPPSRRGRAA